MYTLDLGTSRGESSLVVPPPGRRGRYLYLCRQTHLQGTRTAAVVGSEIVL